MNVQKFREILMPIEVPTEQVAALIEMLLRVLEEQDARIAKLESKDSGGG